jgi:hypothetical protein
VRILSRLRRASERRGRSVWFGDVVTVFSHGSLDKRNHGSL